MRRSLRGAARQSRGRGGGRGRRLVRRALAAAGLRRLLDGGDRRGGWASIPTSTTSGRPRPRCSGTASPSSATAGSSTRRSSPICSGRWRRLPYAAAKGLFTAADAGRLDRRRAAGSTAGPDAAGSRGLLRGQRALLPVLPPPRARTDRSADPAAAGARLARARRVPGQRARRWRRARTLKPALAGLLPVVWAAGRGRSALAALGVGAALARTVCARRRPGAAREYANDVFPRAALYGEGGTEEMLLPASRFSATGDSADGIDDGTTRLDGRRYQTAIGDAPAAASLPRLLAPDAPSRAAARFPFLLAIGGLALLAWRLRARGDATTEALLFWAAAVACVVTSPAGWVMGLVLALPLAPLVAALRRRRTPRARGPTIALARRLGSRRAAGAIRGLGSAGGRRPDRRRGCRCEHGDSAGPAGSAEMIVLGLSLGLLAAGRHLRGARHRSADESRATRAVRVMVWAFADPGDRRGDARRAWPARCAEHAGSAGRRGSRRWPSGLASGASPGSRRRGASRHRPRRRLRLGAGARPSLLRAWAGLHKTTFLYDTLSYHLHVPATWMPIAGWRSSPRCSAIRRPPTRRRTSSSGSLFLMAPLRSDYLAGIGPAPVRRARRAAIVAAVREAGGRRPPRWRQRSPSCSSRRSGSRRRPAMTDLGMAALLLAVASVQLAAARQRPRPATC